MALLFDSVSPARAQFAPQGFGIEQCEDALGEIRRVVGPGVKRRVARLPPPFDEVKEDDGPRVRHVLEDLVLGGLIVQGGLRIGRHANVGG